MRILALDVGSKTIGLAVSDPIGWTAQSLTTLDRKGEERDIAAILSWVEKLEAKEILIGLPLNMNGSEGPQAERVRAFGEKLGQALSIPFRFWDERLSTVAAEKTLLEADLSREKRKKVINQMAAAFILQGYLDSLRQDSER